MDEQLLINDIRRVTRLLSRVSLARIEAVRAEAAADLLTDLSRCWESVAVSPASLRAHDPSELIPFFEAYAERQYDSYAEEMLPHFPDLEQYALHLAIHVTDAISNEIRPNRGFMLKNRLSGEWTELVRMLKESEPDAQEELRKELSDLSGDWEIYLGRSFERHVLKTGGISRRWNNPEAREAIQLFSLVFQFKYQFHLRLFTNSNDFDMRLRAHVSNRLAYWEAQAARRAAKQSDETAVPKLGVLVSGRAQPIAGTPRRVPNLDLSRERLRFLDELASELATLKQNLKGYCTVEGIKTRYPKFKLWTLLSSPEIQELLNGEAFAPKAFAETLTIRKFGITSRETLRKDRKKVRKAQ